MLNEGHYCSSVIRALTAAAALPMPFIDGAALQLKAKVSCSIKLAASAASGWAER